MNFSYFLHWISSRAKAIRWLLLFIAVLYVVETLDVFALNQRLNQWGVQPRVHESLRNIPLMPFLHDGYGHLIGNTAPLVVLGGMTVLYGAGTFAATTLICTLTSGLGIWLLSSPNTVHIGASGLVFGYFGFLVARALFDHSLFSVVVAGGVLVAYGSLVFMLSPFQAEVSWEGHLFGLLGGFFSAAILTPAANRDRQKRLEELSSNPASPGSSTSSRKAAGSTSKSKSTKSPARKSAPKKKTPSAGRSSRSGSGTSKNTRAKSGKSGSASSTKAKPRSRQKR
jgi:membrane associated rhomboid family serine protease